MSKLITLNDLNFDNFTSLLSDSEIIVYENIKGNKILFTYENDRFRVKTRNLMNDDLNQIDLALQKYYKKLFDYLESLDFRVKKLLNKGWWFCCQYFYDEQPSDIKYDKIPKNNLILTSIVKKNKYTFEVDEIKEYAELLNILPQPIIFYGNLHESQIKLIKYFLNTSPEDLDYIFGEENFASFFYKILNPAKENSILMDSGNYNNFDKLIIRINNSDEMSFSILNPLYDKTMPISNHVDTYTIMLMDFIEFLQTTNIDKFVLKSSNSDSLYIELICKLFNEYCAIREYKIMNYDFDIPPFFSDDKFKLNLELIQNDKTKSLILKSDKLEYFFKILLSSFRSLKRKPIGIFSEKTLSIFNDYVNRIIALIDKKLKIKQDIELQRHDLLDFDKFYDITYPQDGEGNVYPDYYSNFDGDNTIINKKNKVTKK